MRPKSNPARRASASPTKLYRREATFRISVGNHRTSDFVFPHEPVSGSAIGPDMARRARWWSSIQQDTLVATPSCSGFTRRRAYVVKSGQGCQGSPHGKPSRPRCPIDRTGMLNGRRSWSCLATQGPRKESRPPCGRRLIRLIRITRNSKHARTDPPASRLYVQLPRQDCLLAGLRFHPTHVMQRLWLSARSFATNTQA